MTTAPEPLVIEPQVTTDMTSSLLATHGITLPLQQYTSSASSFASPESVEGSRSVFAHLIPTQNNNSTTPGLQQTQDADKKKLAQLKKLLAQSGTFKKPRQTRRQYRQYTDEQLDNALRDVKAGMNRSKAARLYGVPETSLRREEVRRLSADYKKY